MNFSNMSLGVINVSMLGHCASSSDAADWKARCLTAVRAPRAVEMPMLHQATTLCACASLAQLTATCYQRALGYRPTCRPPI